MYPNSLIFQGIRAFLYIRKVHNEKNKKKTPFKPNNSFFFAYNVIVGDAFVPDSVLYHRCSVYDLSLIKAGGVVPPGDFSDP